MVTPAEAKTDRTWTVGELADDLGVTTRTLRFYEAEGLISPRRVGTSRIYSPRDRARLRLILRGKRFGMSLAEIREIVDMYDGAASSERRQLATLLARWTTSPPTCGPASPTCSARSTRSTTWPARCRTRLAELDG